MAFYAEIYGYISIRKGSSQSIEEINSHFAAHLSFLPCFSKITEGKTLDFVPFACNVKLDQGEDDFWLKPFESGLTKTDFVSAVVNIMHEATDHIMMYSYVRDGALRKFVSKQKEEFIEEGVVQE